MEHRAVTDKEKDRLSIVTFYAPSYDIELGPIPQLVNGNLPCKYKRYSHGEYSKHYVTNKLASRQENPGICQDQSNPKLFIEGAQKVL